MKFTNVTIDSYYEKEITKKLMAGAGYKVLWSDFTEEQKIKMCDSLKKIAQIKKYTPEERYLVFVIREFTRFARSLRRAAFVESDICIELYSYDIIGNDSPFTKDFLTLTNNAMRTNTEESLAMAIMIDKIVAEILDRELDALEGIYYTAFPTDFELKEDIVNSGLQVCETTSLEKKPQKTTFVDAPEGKKKMNFEDFLKMLGDIAEEIEKSKPSTAAKQKSQTKQDIATNFINSATKTQKKNNKFDW